MKSKQGSLAATKYGNSQAPIMMSHRNAKSKKSTVMIKDVVVDDDCVVLDCDPNNPVAEVNHKANYGSKSNDLLIVAEKGQIACRDYPHPRHLCVKYPFNSTPHYKHCDQCHCYVCECRAPCPLWNSDSVISNDRHCHATYKDERWRTLKKQFKPIKNTKVSHGNQARPLGNFRLSSNSVHPSQVSRPRTVHPCSTLNNLSVPNIISQGKSQQPAPILAKNGVHSQLISKQSLGVGHSVTQRNPVPRIAPSHTMFKKTGSVSVKEAQHTRNASSTAFLNKRNPINVQPSANLHIGRPDSIYVEKLVQLMDSMSQSLARLEQSLKKWKGQKYKG